MVPFSIAGVQMHVSASHSNVPLMKHKIDVTMSVYPWVQMIVFTGEGFWDAFGDWSLVVFSKTLIPFHGVLIGAVVVVMFIHMSN